MGHPALGDSSQAVVGSKNDPRPCRGYKGGLPALRQVYLEVGVHRTFQAAIWRCRVVGM
jgi:hypothetical protein